jgi:hypothetical protein
MLVAYNYVFIVIGVLIILWSIFDYKILNPILFGNKKKYRLISKKVSPLIFKYNKIDDYINIIIGIFMILIGLYGILYNIHDKNNVNFKDIIHNIFNNEKED